MADGTGAPGREIEITPEMIEARGWAILEFDRDFGADEDAVRRIYRVMRRVENS
jgi:hypothetical protein